jgi:Fur family ferric uptake transcriptional regulator
MSELRKLHQYLRIKGLKNTQQREEIARTFLGSGHHLSAEELYQRIRKAHPDVGLSTVYRTLKLLVNAGLAGQRQFGDGITRYEPQTSDEHHDHLICIRCGAIIEFENQNIEDLQKKVAARNNFTVLRHKLELYGYCDTCRRAITGPAGDGADNKRLKR